MLCCCPSSESPPPKKKNNQAVKKQSSPSKENLVGEDAKHTTSATNPAFDRHPEQTKSENKKRQVHNNNHVATPESVHLQETNLSVPPAQEDEIDPIMAAELAGLVSRLEAVTNRLESVAGGGGGAGAGAAPGE